MGILSSLVQPSRPDTAKQQKGGFWEKFNQFGDELLNPTTGLGKLGAYLGAAAGNPLGLAAIAAMKDARSGEDLALDREYKMAQIAKLRAPVVPQTTDLEDRVRFLNAFKPGLGGTYAENYAANGGGAPQIVTTAQGTFAIPRGAIGGTPTLPQIGEVIDDPRKAGGAGASPRPFR